MPPRKTNPDELRALFEAGYTVSAIAKRFDLHYSTVYNALKVDAEFFREEAEKRGISTTMLKNRLLRVIVKDKLINAILDDKDDETSR